jgi:hypothetical protein
VSGLRGRVGSTSLIAVLALLALTGCTHVSDAQKALAKQTVASLEPPSGWADDDPLDVACHPWNKNCDDDTAHISFRSPTGSAEQACASVVGWLGTAPVFGDALAIRGADTAAPSAADCVAELDSVHEYVVRAHATVPGMPDSARWSVRLTPRPLGGFSLSVALGSPPRDPWQPTVD